jgi:hypothetical protein
MGPWGMIGWCHARPNGMLSHRRSVTSHREPEMTIATPASSIPPSQAKPILRAAEISDEYGWRHFGTSMPIMRLSAIRASPAYPHYNNQYDVIYGMLISISEVDVRWFHLMCDLARHVIDIDIYIHRRSTRLQRRFVLAYGSLYRCGTATHRSFTGQLRHSGSCHGGGPSNEQHNYTTGLPTTTS